MINVALNPSDAVENALNLFGDAVLRLAYSYLKTREDAEDVVQDTLIRLMQSEEIFENEEHMKAWMLRVAANLCKDILKSSRRQKEVAMVEGYEEGVEDEYNVENSDSKMEFGTHLFVIKEDGTIGTVGEDNYYVVESVKKI